MPSIILAKQLIADNDLVPGARACVGMISLSQYLAALAKYDITSGLQSTDENINIRGGFLYNHYHAGDLH